MKHFRSFRSFREQKEVAHERLLRGRPMTFSPEIAAEAIKQYNSAMGQAHERDRMKRQTEAELQPFWPGVVVKDFGSEGGVFTCQAFSPSTKEHPAGYLIAEVHGDERFHKLLEIVRDIVRGK